MKESRGRWRHWAAVSLLAIAFLVLVWAHHRFLTSGDRYASRDYMALWAGGRALLEGLDPYDTEAWVELRRSYGSTWMPDPRAPLPLWTLALLSPIAALPLGWAAAAWLVSLELALGASVLLLVAAARRKPPTVIEVLLLFVAAFAMRGTLVTLQNGQIGLLTLVALTGFLVLWWRGMPFLAGAALSMVAKPNAYLLFVPVVGLWLLRHRRWRAIAGAASGAALLFGVSALLRPGWLAAWLTVRAKTEATYRTPTVWGAAYVIAPEPWPVVGLILTPGITAWVDWLALRRAQCDPAYVVGLALCASLAVTPYVWAYEHTLLVLPLTLLYAAPDVPGPDAARSHAPTTCPRRGAQDGRLAWLGTLPVGCAATWRARVSARRLAVATRCLGVFLRPLLGSPIPPHGRCAPARRPR
ncbi:MAG: DUF2029 domain-containing protein [Anaerolineae bacterium]|nr:DUF2029 domain-containing protein [Anaerolineae bacterium]